MCVERTACTGGDRRAQTHPLPVFFFWLVFFVVLPVSAEERRKNVKNTFSQKKKKEGLPRSERGRETQCFEKKPGVQWQRSLLLFLLLFFFVVPLSPDPAGPEQRKKKKSHAVFSNGKVFKLESGPLPRILSQIY